VIGIFGSFSVPQVPSGTGFFSNLPTAASDFVVQLVAYKGPYLMVVTAQGNGVSEETATREVATHWATAEYHQLPA
jgi:hypothetical protein